MQCAHANVGELAGWANVIAAAVSLQIDKSGPSGGPSPFSKVVRLMDESD